MKHATSCVKDFTKGIKYSNVTWLACKFIRLQVGMSLMNSVAVTFA